MTLGSGIFFGTIVLALVYLYVKSENKTRLRKGMRYTTIGFLVLLISLFGYAVSEKFLKDSLFSGSESVTPPNQLLGIQVGSKFTDVQFKHGKFFLEKDKEVCQHERYTQTNTANSKSSEPYKLSNNTKREYFSNNHERGHSRAQLCVKNDIVEQVIYGCDPDSVSNLILGEQLHHIKCNDSSETILRHYKSVKALCNKDNVAIRIYDVEDLRIRFILDTDKVIYLWASNGEFPVNTAFSTCQ
jgi:hypothetical protein